MYKVWNRNNVGERSLRFPITSCKRSFATKLESGKRFVERIMTLRQNCHQKHKEHFLFSLKIFMIGITDLYGIFDLNITYTLSGYMARK